LKFEQDVVYLFTGAIFRSFFSEQPLKPDIDLIDIGEKWKTIIFFMTGSWIFLFGFTVISKKEAVERKKAFELKTDSEKFGL
jgi:hypothetical protein